MGPEFWNLDKASRLKKCSEQKSNPCSDETDGCCAVIPCSYCLTWSVYGSDDTYATAAFATDGWYATIAGVEFRGYWERNYESGECEFIVTLDSAEIYRLDCYGGQSCRDSSDSAEATIGYDTGTLTWTKIEPRPLEYVTDPDTFCKTHFCGTCECSCDCLCVTITPNTGNIFLDVPIYGEACDTSYPCDAPVWEGTIVGAYEDYVLSLTLGRDEYTGDCVIYGTVNGEEVEPQVVVGCDDMSTTITLYDGTTIAVRCKVCGCDTSQACEYCCLPMDFTNPLYPLGIMSDIPFSISGCLTYSGTFRALPGNEPCQAELIYDDVCAFGRECGTFLQTPPIAKYTETGGVCSTTPCNTSVAYKLECTARYNEPGDDQNCDRLWLWIGANAMTQVGDIGETPGGYVYTGFSWRRVRADSCMCDNTDGLVASFNADVVADCTGADIGYDGDCAGQPLDCCPINCVSTLVI
jgi:hypothetical protein